MPGGRRNLLSMTRMLESLNDSVSSARDSAHKRKDSLTKKLADIGIEVPLVDLQIQFIGATGLPKMDVVGSADPYFVAKLDDQISFVSNVIPNTLSPVWNELWRVKNVPSSASLVIEVLDKDEGSATDDFIGKINVGVAPGAKEIGIEGTLFALRKTRGTFWLKIDSKHSTMRQRHEFKYLFDGPVRFTRHFSPTVGLLTSSSTAAGAVAGDRTSVRDNRLYSTWKFYIEGVPLFFRDVHQSWNKKYPAAQKIFGAGPASLAVRSGIQAGHRMLYARLASNGYGIIDNRCGGENGDTEEPVGLKEVLHAGGSGSNSDERIKPAVYTYIISSADDTWRFSETGAAFFVDFASKHALHANCAQHVRYSGEFHPRPVGGWANFNESIGDDDVDWELVVDNNSGTYAPDKMMLPTVQECLEYNFGCRIPGKNSKGNRGFKVVVYDREDERLVKSVAECREYAVKVRGVMAEELQPHVNAGEVTLSQAVSREEEPPAVQSDVPIPAQA